MNISYRIIILVLVFFLVSCREKKNDNINFKVAESVSSDLLVDHINIWVNNPIIAKEKLTNIGFASVPNSLSPIHIGQGTTGRYFYFLNGYLELIFVYEQNEFDKNIAKNKDLDFAQRANFENNGASPISIALKVKDYNIEKIPFQKIRYHQDWMEPNAAIYSAKNSKTHLNEPSIFVVYPEIESKIFESLSEIENIDSEDSFWKEFFKHPNGAKKLTSISITTTNLDLNTKSIKAVNGIENLTVKSGNEHLLKLYFDNNIQEKTFDLRPELPLIVYL